MLLLFIATKSRLTGSSDGSISQFLSSTMPVLLQRKLYLCVNNVMSRFEGVLQNEVLRSP